jgi:predicted TIM-barrel fold metal-dependent hydrolase
MGRISADPAAVTQLATWREQPGMLGVRIILAAGGPWREAGVAHPLWRAAEASGAPVTIAPSGAIGLVGDIARARPDLKIIVDHMGARVDRRGPDAFVDFDDLLRLARLANVAVKATCLPAYSAGARPWADVTPYLRRAFDAFGPRRLFWGSDLSRLPCPYGELVDFFRDGLPWLGGDDRDEVMGRALLRWLDWR